MLPGGERLAELPGQALATGRMLCEGTEVLTWDEIASRTEERGIELFGGAGFDVHGVSVDALAEDWREAIDWTARTLLEPSFPETRLEWLRGRTLAELASWSERPDAAAELALLHQLYGEHPRAHLLEGTENGLLELSPQACRRFHRAALGRGLVIAVAGPIDRHRVAEHVRRALRLPRLERPIDEDPVPLDRRPADRRSVTVRGEQGHLLLGALTVPRAHPDWPALELLGVALGDGPGLAGRLPARVRERDGLAYTVSVDTLEAAGVDPGRLVVRLSTTTASLAPAESAVRDELSRLVETGVGEEELASGVAFLAASEAFGRETPAQWARLLVEAELLGMPVDDVDWVVDGWRQLTPESVRDVCRRWLLPQDLQVVVGVPDRGI